TAKAVRARMRELGINYPEYLAAGQGVSQALGGVVLTPTSILVNGKGRIVGRYVGAIALPVIVWKLLWTWG
ncbi:TlpA family protein disulfide reductase, partial [Acidithiobacillus thiooxidans]|uniref:TlpA family protein disulfide reductase n=1 Tax=Acidithiobacillus thiooxidans TaxID=930 RepID=UPI000AD8F018